MITSRTKSLAYRIIFAATTIGLQVCIVATVEQEQKLAVQAYLTTLKMAYDDARDALRTAVTTNSKDLAVTLPVAQRAILSAVRYGAALNIESLQATRPLARLFNELLLNSDRAIGKKSNVPETRTGTIALPGLGGALTVEVPRNITEDVGGLSLATYLRLARLTIKTASRPVQDQWTRFVDIALALAEQNQDTWPRLLSPSDKDAIAAAQFVGGITSTRRMSTADSSDPRYQNHSCAELANRGRLNFYTTEFTKLLAQAACTGHLCLFRHTQALKRIYDSAENIQTACQRSFPLPKALAQGSVYQYQTTQYQTTDPKNPFFGQD